MKLKPFGTPIRDPHWTPRTFSDVLDDLRALMEAEVERIDETGGNYRGPLGKRLDKVQQAVEILEATQ